MAGRTGASTDGRAARRADDKRWSWMLALIYPLQPFVTIGLHATTGSEAWFAVPFVFMYFVAPAVAPLFDEWFGKTHNDPPEEFSELLEQDPYYRRLTYLAVPLHFVTFLGTIWYATVQPLSTWAFVILAAHAGQVAGLAIVTGHELGHKKSKFEKRLASIVLAIPAYGHFMIGHNRRHHKHVATAADAASARMGESIYRFAGREIPGTFRGAWKIETERLRNDNKPVWHPGNQILQSYALSAFMTVALLLALGWPVIPFLLVHHAVAYWQLTSANYIEHYGLLRRTDEHGNLERYEPHHAWNARHTFGVSIFFHLERHSDHHAYPLRRYQALRNQEDWPQLPSSYFGMYVLAYLPHLWFRVMDKRLMALPHVGGKLSNVNIDPVAKQSILKRWGTEPLAEATIR
jgi:alkane 1-monooxygenase